MDIWSRVLVWRTELMLLGANHRRRTTLRRELASYTPTELVDLEAVIERYPLGQTPRAALDAGRPTAPEGVGPASTRRLSAYSAPTGVRGSSWSSTSRCEWRL